MATAKLFRLGNSQAVRIPAQHRIDAAEVEFIQRGTDLLMRPKIRTAADLFAVARAKGGDFSNWVRPTQGQVEPAPDWK